MPAIFMTFLAVNLPGCLYISIARKGLQQHFFNFLSSCNFLMCMLDCKYSNKQISYKNQQILPLSNFPYYVFQTIIFLYIFCQKLS